MYGRDHIREGMEAWSSDGEKLGKVRACDADGFIIEKGIFFPKEYFVRYEHVASASGDELRLSLPKDQLGNVGEADLRYRQGEVPARDRDLGQAPAGQILADEPLGGAGREGWTGSPRDARREDELRMTRAEEELDVVKRQREAGEVRLRKDVVTETKHIDVPVTREEVHVERTPIDAPRPAAAGEARFEKESIAMPLVEEEVEIRKRPVVKEEVRVRRERTQQEQRADAEIRREEVRVEGEDEARDRGIGGGERQGEDRPGFGRGLGAPSDDDLIR